MKKIKRPNKMTNKGSATCNRCGGAHHNITLAYWLRQLAIGCRKMYKNTKSCKEAK